MRSFGVICRNIDIRRFLMGVGSNNIQQVRQTAQPQQIQIDQQVQLPQAMIDQQERERLEQMRREQRLVPQTGVKAKAKKWLKCLIS